jgi:hypothetical protein
MQGKTASKIVIAMKYLDGHPMWIESSRSASGEAAILTTWKGLPAGHHAHKRIDLAHEMR